MNKPYELLFTDFVSQVQPSGATNRLPAIGAGQDVLSYSVYLNGDLAKTLPDDMREHHYKDVMVHALTEKLGLDATNHRDNLRVAELVSLRSTWMSIVLEASTAISINGHITLSDAVIRDYESVSNDLSHDYFKQEISKQALLARTIKPALQTAMESIGSELTEVVAYSVNQGKIIAQNSDFSVQELNGNSVVAHENRRLQVIPAVGSDVTVTYYRGNGQVFGNDHAIAISEPYVDDKYAALAVAVMNVHDNKHQVVLFNGVSDFSNFVATQALPKTLIAEALTLHEHAGRLKIANSIVDRNKELGISLDRNTIVATLESQSGPDKGYFVGRILSVDEKNGLVVQAQGMGKAIVHLSKALSDVPAVGETGIIKYKGGLGTVNVDRSQDSSQSRV